ncbi:hypothetical protein ACJZRZ_000958 [Vibrio parahaemolyticus]|uniref:hypothetical protein n=1 Tax=Vibrio parahaemolyticus TaxID=670 RepID=UPI0004D41928|nr:hypothetical protein [Vibrio parahaemolyticus]EKF6650568.1 hypothetical protein [Vibrio parahaemolyticus]ELS3451114.1 hypothetical protein [Vibrio vulnificus]ELS9097777.1 hypothetical protein [Vibrio vulnificus]OQU46148.1 hypothetical protein EM73_007020 [Vibrio parahaemolyticus]
MKIEFDVFNPYLITHDENTAIVEFLNEDKIHLSLQLHKGDEAVCRTVQKYFDEIIDSADTVIGVSVVGFASPLEYFLAFDDTNNEYVLYLIDNVNREAAIFRLTRDDDTGLFVYDTYANQM